MLRANKKQKLQKSRLITIIGDFMGIALTHCEEITKLLERHEEHIWNMYAEMEAVAEPVVPAAQKEATAEDKDDEDSGEPSILNVLNED
jgi:hypothetical protein